MWPAEPDKSSRAGSSTLVELPVMSKRQRTAFTLVELLVVIGIIAVLLAMLLPALNRVRRQAISVQCQSNLRQLLLAAQLYANDNGGVMPGYDSTNITDATNSWWLTLAKYVAPPDFNPDDPKHNRVAIYNCPGCDANLLQAASLGLPDYRSCPVTYAISWCASDAAPASVNAHGGAYQYTKSTQWFAANFVLFADAFPYTLVLPDGNYGGGDVFWYPNQLGFDSVVAFYHGSGNWIYAAGNSPMRTNAGFLDGHVDALSAEDFCRSYLSPENVARCPAGKPALNSGWLYIPFLPPYGAGRLYP